jgi:hypothetical protein
MRGLRIKGPLAHKHVFVGIENWKNRMCGLN